MVPRTASDLQRSAAQLSETLALKTHDPAWSAEQVEALRNRVLEVEAQCLLLRLRNTAPTARKST